MLLTRVFCRNTKFKKILNNGHFNNFKTLIMIFFLSVIHCTILFLT